MEDALLFIKIENPEDIRNLIYLAREKLAKAGHILMEVENLESEERRVFESWKKEMEDVKGKIEDASAMLPETDV